MYACHSVPKQIIFQQINFFAHNNLWKCGYTCIFVHIKADSNYENPSLKASCQTERTQNYYIEHLINSIWDLNISCYPSPYKRLLQRVKVSVVDWHSTMLQLNPALVAFSSTITTCSNTNWFKQSRAFEKPPLQSWGGGRGWTKHLFHQTSYNPQCWIQMPHGIQVSIKDFILSCDTILLIEQILLLSTAHEIEQVNTELDQNWNY